MWHYLCVLSMPPKHYKYRGEQWKNLDQFLTYNLDQFFNL